MSLDEGGLSVGNLKKNLIGGEAIQQIQTPKPTVEVKDRTNQSREKFALAITPTPHWQTAEQGRRLHFAKQIEGVGGIRLGEGSGCVITGYSLG